ncbi:hypothetical protein NQL31_002912 [Lotmaria passim]
MSAHSRPVHDVLGRMSDEEGDDDIPDDLEIAFVPRSERLQRWQQSRPPAHSASTFSSSPPSTGGAVSSTAAANTATPAATTVVRRETVYEQERNAKVRALLAEQQRTHKCSGVFSLDLLDGPLDEVADGKATTAAGASSSAAFSPLSFTRGNALPQRGRRPYEFSSYRGRGGANSYTANTYNNDNAPSINNGHAPRDRQRRYHMPHPNMSDEEQARYIRARRNMAVTRNALREVDPETLEYTQVTQAADQVLSGRGGGGTTTRFSSGYARGGRGIGYRGRGGGGRGQGYGNIAGAAAARGGRGGVFFNPYM